MPPRRPTNREIEIKLRISDAPALFRHLRRLGASKRGRVLERNVLYDTPDSDFRRRGWLLRLRIETPARSALARAGTHRAVLTFKTSLLQRGRPFLHRPRYKERLEREAIVSEPGRWPNVLRSFGLHPGFRYEKYRTELRLPGLHLCLDETPIGVFLELEGSPSAIDWVAGALGFSPRDYIQATYWDLYAAARRRRGLSVRNMLFHV